MSKITDAMLKAIMPYATKARRDAALPIINHTALQYGITTERRIAAWLATLSIESGDLKYQEEIANGSAYEGRRDLGNTQKGDGRRFKGRGRIQNTGRDVYTKYTNYLRKSGHLPFVDFTKEPEKLALEPYATDSSGWFVNGYKNINGLADANNFLQYSIRVNGRNRKTGLPNHWKERNAAYQRALRVIPDDFKLTGDLNDAQALVTKAELNNGDNSDYPDFELTSTAVSPNIEQPNGLPEDEEIGDLSTANATIVSESGAGDKNAANGQETQKDGTSEEGKEPPATTDAEVIREKPSTFVRWFVAIKTFIGGIITLIGGYLGVDDIKAAIAANQAHIFNGEFIALIAILVFKLLIVVAIGAGLMWIASVIYDHAAKRANERTKQLIETASNTTVNTVKLKG